ncbi:Uncharacterised protein [Mycobacteroides abscessus subsp. bolletii]|nr:Uncharacterised protein [Mycobacteroides abscessus subsp. bolletii]SIF43900.1 Uncharacterised protein [Mycobacteroides abscessus subsp. bolletii]SKD31470.1 Uncharacterised protein [Mycobacteroides abscessus subsp. bolletii]SKD64348.1 Uncharacterised protein [Mycobacteroides abscessus subsp. bolletii]SKJ42395.1 Uncharacterised protein [Mycobacteroides abscessus subsp. bolletii]
MKDRRRAERYPLLPARQAVGDLDLTAAFRQAISQRLCLMPDRFRLVCFGPVAR